MRAMHVAGPDCLESPCPWKYYSGTLTVVMLSFYDKLEFLEIAPFGFIL